MRWEFSGSIFLGFLCFFLLFMGFLSFDFFFSSYVACLFFVLYSFHLLWCGFLSLNKFQSPCSPISIRSCVEMSTSCVLSSVMPRKRQSIISLFLMQSKKPRRGHISQDADVLVVGLTRLLVPTIKFKAFEKLLSLAEEMLLKLRYYVSHFRSDLPPWWTWIPCKYWVIGIITVQQ